MTNLKPEVSKKIEKIAKTIIRWSKNCNMKGEYFICSQVLYLINEEYKTNYKPYNR